MRSNIGQSWHYLRRRVLNMSVVSILNYENFPTRYVRIYIYINGTRLVMDICSFNQY